MSFNLALEIPEILKTRRSYRPVEKLLHPIAEHYVPELTVYKWIPYDMEGRPYLGDPFVLIRQDVPNGSDHSHPSGLLLSAYVEVQVYIQSSTEISNALGELIDPENAGLDYSHAILTAFRTAKDESFIVPGAGYLTSIKVISAPKRVTDWATSQGPVQYADLPNGALRFETKLEVWFRPDRSQIYPQEV